MLFYGDKKYVVKYGKYNKHCGLSNVEARYIGASFYLDATGINKHHLSYEITKEIIDEQGVAHLHQAGKEWENRMERYHELWALEIIGNIYDNPELLEVS